MLCNPPVCFLNFAISLIGVFDIERAGETFEIAGFDAHSLKIGQSLAEPWRIPDVLVTAAGTGIAQNFKRVLGTLENGDFICPMAEIGDFSPVRLIE